MQVQNPALLAHLQSLPKADAALIEKAKRPLDMSDVNNSFNSKYITVLLSPDLIQITQQIDGKPVTYGGFAVAYFNKETGAYVKPGTISANAFSRVYYKNQGEATGAVKAVNNADNFGENALVVAQKMFEAGGGVVLDKVDALYAANFVNNRMSFENMVKRDRNLFTISTALPAGVATFMASAA